MRSRFTLRFIGDVDPRLRRSMLIFAGWVRLDYIFLVPLEIRLNAQRELEDHDGTIWHIIRWQSTKGREPVRVEMAVGDFACEVNEFGEGAALNKVAFNMARQLKHYFQMVNDYPQRRDHASRWAEKLVDAYLNNTSTPKPVKESVFAEPEEWLEFHNKDV